MSALTPKQQAYLHYIERYIALHGRAPAEHEMQAYFRVTPPSVHRMVVVLEEKGAIRRQAGVARSIEVVTNARRLAGQSVETVVVPDVVSGRAPGAFVGRWRIVETEGWTRDVLDESVPANITFDERGHGHFQMVYVEGDIDCRFNGNRVEFSWSGVDDRRQKSGRGWAELQADGALRGRIYFHCGDDYSFVALRDEAPPVTRPARMPVFRPGRRR
jgi:hypothetical protein